MPASQELSLHRGAALALAALLLAGPLCLVLRGPPGLFLYLTLWVVALPIVLAPLRAALFSELPGALFVFLTAARADSLDDLWGQQQRVSLALVLLSLGYLVLRRDEVRAVLRSPIAVWLALFFVQQIANAFLLQSPEAGPVWQGRISVFAALLAGAVLARRPDGARLLLMLLILGVLVSVPIMGFEITHPDVQLFSVSDTGYGRAGGMFSEPNEVGCVLSFAIAAVIALRTRAQLSRIFAALLGGAFALGLLACASRGAFAAVLLVLGVNAWAQLARRVGRAPVATAGLALGVALLVLPLVAQGLVAATSRVPSLKSENAERLAQVVLAVGGSPDELAGDDSSRTDLAVSAMQLIGERPLFGFGTSMFSVMDKRGKHSHMQFLEVLGENGLVGLLLYAAVWIALLSVLSRLAPEHRLGGALLVAAWLVAHFDSHTVIVYRYYILPVAYVCGLGVEPADARG